MRRLGNERTILSAAKWKMQEVKNGKRAQTNG
jgi:hypothetical protein